VFSMNLELLHSLQAVTALALIAVRLALRISDVVGARFKPKSEGYRAAKPLMPDRDRPRAAGLAPVAYSVLCASFRIFAEQNRENWSCNNREMITFSMHK
jgi:hypothetical protein